MSSGTTLHRLGAASSIGVERRAQRLGRPMEPRLRGAQRDTHRRGGVRQRQAKVVVKDDDGALLRVEAADAALDLVPVGRGRLGVRHRGGIDLGELDLDAPSLGCPELIAAGVEEQPVEPGIEAVGVAQRGEVPPAPDERLLDGVLGAVGVPRMRRAAASSRPIVAPASTAKAS